MDTNCSEWLDRIRARPFTDPPSCSFGNTRDWVVSLQAVIAAPFIKHLDIFSNLCVELEISISIKEGIVEDQFETATTFESFSISDLLTIFEGWQRGCNPHWKSLVPIVNEKLESIITEPKKLEKLKTADFALFASCWWPQSDLSQLTILAFLSIWLFVWDDEIDESTGSLTDNLTAAQAFRAETVLFLEHCLGLSTWEDSWHEPGPIISSFKPIGDAISSVYNIDQRRNFMKEIIFFMEMSEIEQRRRLSPELPTIGEYWECRMGTSAVGVCIAMLEFSCQFCSFATPWERRFLWDKTNVIISLTNDLLSLKKEIELGCVDSLVPIAAAADGNPQRAIDEAVAALYNLKACFDEEIKTFLVTPTLQGQEKWTREFIKLCQFNCTGNLTWSLSTKRYNVKEYIQGDGTIVFTL
ncbi:hypothetical protein G7Y89_g8253 [Cudoniella acicularis]|uniref:Terpene synthase n=1 Tax=Cudoniella acicularis TaxID=354080 RepID=A0A8H4W0S5_9HELO|nr:hypothetical protein G7Y89_g8253 [Cudoniella acicularis]